MPRFFIAALVAIAFITHAVHGATAQPGGNKGAAKAEARARAYYRAGAFIDAAKAFEKAYALAPQTSTLFNIARSYEEAGKKQHAVEYFKKFLADKPKNQDLATEADARMRALEEKLAKERAKAKEAAEAKERKKEADKLVAAGSDKLAAGAFDEAIAQYQQAFAIDPDPATVYKMAEAYRKKGESSRAIGEYKRYRTLAPTGPLAGNAFAQVEALEAELARKRGPTTMSQGPGISAREISGIVVGGAGIVSAATGIVLGFVAKSKWSDVHEDCKFTYPTCSADTVALGKQAGTFANAATVTMVVGVAAIGAGAFLYFAAPDHRASEEKEAVSVAPAMSTHSLAVVVGGRF